VKPGQKRQVVRWHIHADADGAIAAARDHIAGAARNAIAKRKAFRIVLSGGETPRRLYERLAATDADWRGWHIYYGDERCLPVGDAQRNNTMAERAWLAGSAIPPSQIHPIPAELGADAGAVAYARELADLGDFDLVLLGLGEDGHTASLFPGRDWGVMLATPAALAVRDAPKPPPDRISLSAWRLSLARSVLVLVAGEGKRDAVNRWGTGENLPIGAIMPAAAIDAFVDKAACPPADVRA
jgi:6-phosphogluconolactonase